MDFVEGLGDTSNLPEFAIDGIGRVEVLHERARITFYRLAQLNDGSSMVIPVYSAVWTVARWLHERDNLVRMHAAIEGRVASIVPEAVRLLHH